MENYLKYITIDPNIRFGKPCIVNTRISVGDILGYLASGMSIDEITEDFPELIKEHITAALSFAANRENMIKIITNDKSAV